MTAAVSYSRFSTDRQDAGSIADQQRLCSEYAERQGWQITEAYSDEGISGASMGNRPAFLHMRADAMAGRFDVLLITDTTRLARSQELAPLIERLRYQGVRVVGVQDSFDSTAATADMQAGMSGLLSVEFRKMIRARTHSALESRAKRGEPTGGRAYGYRPGEGEVVQKIFRLYADGYSPRRIAEMLNEKGIASPGAGWNRTTRRRGGWSPSAIHGGQERGGGILRAEVYIGVVTWGRTAWTKDPDTGLRRCVQRPRSQWVVREKPELRLIDDELWNAVKARLARRSAEVGDAIRRKLKRSLGRAPRYLFSSILKCKVCGSSYVQRGATHYICSGFINGAICTNKQTFRRSLMENKLLGAIKDELLCDASIERFTARLVKRLRRPAIDTAGPAKKLETEIANMVAAIATGIRSPALLERLQSAERDLERLRAQSKVTDVQAVMALIPVAVERYKRWAADLGNAPIDIARGREIIKEIADRIPVRPGPDGVPIAELSLNEQMALGSVAGSDIDVVAGAGFEPATFGL